MPLGTEVGLGPGQIGTQLPLVLYPQRGTAPNVCCGQMAGWITMPSGKEVGLGPGDIELNGDPAPPPKKKGGTSAPTFRPMSIVAKLSTISATAELLLKHSCYFCMLLLANKGIDRCCSGGHVPNIWTGDTVTSVPYYLRSQVELSLFHSWPPHRNAELWILCNVLFVCMVWY